MNKNKLIKRCKQGIQLFGMKNLLIKKAQQGTELIPQTTIHGMNALKSDELYKQANFKDKRLMRQTMRNDGSITVNYEDHANANFTPEDIAMSKRMDDHSNVFTYTYSDTYSNQHNNDINQANSNNIALAFTSTPLGDIVSLYYSDNYDDLKGKGTYINYNLIYNSDTDRYGYEINKNGRIKHRENVKFKRLPDNFLQQLNTYRADL